MSHILIDILLSIMLYGILLAIIIKRKQKRKPNNRSNDDDDGGILSWTPPELDLPPGVSLPVTPVKNRETEHVLFD